MPHNQVLVVQLLREPEVAALCPVPYRTDVNGLLYDLRGETVRRGVAIAELGELVVPPGRRLRLEDLHPPFRPVATVRRAQDRVHLLQEPPDDLGLGPDQGLVLHAPAADQERVEVGDHRLHELLRVGDQQAARVHRVALVVLVDHDPRGPAVADGVQVGVHVEGLGPSPRLPAEHGGEVLAHDVDFSEHLLGQVEAPYRRGGPILDVTVLVCDRRVVDLVLQRLQGLLQSLAGLVPARPGLVVHRKSSIFRGVLDLLLVLVVADLHEGDKAGEDALLRGLPLDVEPLADGDAAQHERDGRRAGGPVDSEPCRLALRLQVRLLPPPELQRAVRAAGIALVVEVRDELPRVRQVLGLLHLLHGPEEPLELPPRQNHHLQLRDGSYGRPALLILDQRDLAEDAALLVPHDLLLLAGCVADRHGLSFGHDEELVAVLVLPDDLVAWVVGPRLQHVRELRDRLGLHHLHQLALLQEQLALLALPVLETDAYVDAVLAPQLPKRAHAVRLHRPPPRHPPQDGELVHDGALRQHLSADPVPVVADHGAGEHHKQPVTNLALLGKHLVHRGAGDAHVDLDGVDELLYELVIVDLEDAE
mmetsp:Transcript_128337/g.348354  ORF Transcript_128337/g.348354 Transcript_128337/m.348354 type:complete len:591 (+) Transcript_128337:274-2046(+)